ncbi:MAG: Panacea domain-containing protein [Solirubrobacterales bacterium]
MIDAMEFNRGKFKELVVYLCASAEQAGDEGFGMVKLNKLLYRSDFEAYRLLGHPITGEIYEKQEFGPVARHLPVALDDLAAAGRLQWQSIPRGPHTRKVPTMTADPDSVADLSRFSPEELRIVKSSEKELAAHGGKSVSEWSHEQSAGWRMARLNGEAIDYASAIISTDPIPEGDLIRARQFVRERGWVKDAP